MRWLLLAALWLSSTSALAQTQTFDLVTFTPPSGWKKEVAANTTTFSTVDPESRSWCQIRIIKSTASKGSIEQDFESEWKELIVRNYKPTSPPTLGAVQAAGGWKKRTGQAHFTFSGSDAVAVLTTLSSGARCMSIAASTNNQAYLEDIEALLSSVQLAIPGRAAQPPATPRADPGLVGTWGMSMVDQYTNRPGAYGSAGSVVKQYTFNPDGTYTFAAKTFRYAYDKLLLTRESGTWQVSGQRLTLEPQRSVIESWSKRDGTDNWGKRLSSEARALEPVTYQFTRHFSQGMQQWSLVLQARPTQRDGPYTGGSAFDNAWLYPAVEARSLLELP